MAQKISVQIALEGGKEVQQELKAIGVTGEEAFQQIDQAAKQVGGFRNLDPGVVTEKLRTMGVTGAASIDRIQQAVSRAGRFEDLGQGIAALEGGFNKAGQAAQRATAAFGLTRREINGVRAALRQIDLGPLGSQLGALGRIGAAFKGPGIAIAGIGAAIAVVTEATLGFAKAVSEISEKVKLDQVTQAFEKLKEAATRGYGAQGTQALQELQKAAEGTGKAAELARQKLVELGLVQAPDIAGKYKEIADSIAGLSRADAATKILQQLQAIRDPAERAAVAAKFFGDEAGPNLAQKLGQGASVASQYATAVSHLITSEDMAKADALNQSIARLSETISRGGTLVFAPGLTAGINAADQALAGLIARAQQNPWGALAQGASLLNPINLIVQSILASLGLIPPAAQAAGQAGAQAGQQGAQGFKNWDDVVKQNTVTFQVWNEQLGKAVPPDAGGWTSWASTVVSAIGSAISKLLEWIGLKDRAGTGTRTGGEGTAVPGVARGGLISGRGSGTSDSNLAWLSRGEFVVRAAAVRQFGAGFFAALNAGMIPGFALGGLVPRPAMAFAGGGPVGGGNHVTIQFPGVPPVGGLRASAAVVEQLQKAAALAQVRSGGRKPSRYS